MLNAYKGIFSDRYPVAPEFWYYYPAKVLGVNMVQFEREMVFWKALGETFKKYGTDGWGIAFGSVSNAEIDVTSSFERISETQYRFRSRRVIGKKVFTSASIYDEYEPSWTIEYPVKKLEDIKDFIDASLSDRVSFDFTNANIAHKQVGESYLLEYCLGSTFFDFIAGWAGFENAVMFFTSEDEYVLLDYQKRLIEFQTELIRKARMETEYESFFLGCSYSCNSLIGPVMWRKWDKPVIESACRELHKHGKFLHAHFHGKSMETAENFAEIGIDCVCPFERPPGGDVEGLNGLKKLRGLLADKVTMNGNVHTVETLIRGTPDDVRREVEEIAEAFKGSARVIFGTGDQVGRETSEENIYAMVEAVKKIKI